MIKQLKLILLSLLFLSMKSYAQQIPVMSQYMFNGLVINPAYAGSKDVSWTANAGYAGLKLHYASGFDTSNSNALTFALSVDGRIVHDRAFGWADGALTEALQPGMKMRVASLTKPVVKAVIDLSKSVA